MLDRDSFAVKVVEETPGILQEARALSEPRPSPHRPLLRARGAGETGVHIPGVHARGVPEGQSLTEYGQFQEDLCCKVAREILRGLEYLHSNNVLHRDLKDAATCCSTARTA
ncbi:unnamed protein product [Prorocentrum cordatum]|uniref:Protein kinase domain-containing protein n=1 Tax=Prorocentrum cordatum TaxID=2364126 RepID=A0ABN9S0P9_9DINO|nr:unnamed protein product [Polarella glacialis]